MNKSKESNHGNNEKTRKQKAEGRRSSVRRRAKIELINPETITPQGASSHYWIRMINSGKVWRVEADLNSGRTGSGTGNVDLSMAP
jgi:hypothetical protein